MRVVIYARVSREEGQDPEIQVKALEAWLGSQGHLVVRVYEDRISGAKRTRPALDELLKEAHEIADAVAVVKLDRLARSMGDLIEIVSSLETQKLDLMVKDQAIDTSTPAGKLMFHVLGAFAEFERGLIIERTKAGLAHARSKGVRLGRPPTEIDIPLARRLVVELGSTSAAAARMGVPRRTLSDRLKKRAA